MDFVKYRKEASVTLSELEKGRNDYFELLAAADLVPKEKPGVSKNLLGLLKYLTDTQNANQCIIKQSCVHQKINI